MGHEDLVNLARGDPERESHPQVVSARARLYVSMVFDHAVAFYDDGSDPNMEYLDAHSKAMHDAMWESELPVLRMALSKESDSSARHEVYALLLQVS